MKTLIEWLKLWTSGHECPRCNEALKMLEDISHRKDDSIHVFNLTVFCNENNAKEFHIEHHNSR